MGMYYSITVREAPWWVCTSHVPLGRHPGVYVPPVSLLGERDPEAHIALLSPLGGRDPEAHIPLVPPWVRGTLRRIYPWFSLG